MYSDYFSDLSPAAQPMLRIETHFDTTPRRLAVFGELDAATADDLREAVAEVLRAEVLRADVLRADVLRADVLRADVLRAEVLQADSLTSSVVDLDLAGLSFADSAGVRCLLVCRENAARAGCRLRLVDPCPAVRRVLEMTGVIQLVEVTGAAPEPATIGPAPIGPAPRRQGRSQVTYRGAGASPTIVDARAIRQAAQRARERAQEMRRDDEARRARIRAARGD
jgi:anti-anti-sigma factor